MDSAHEARLLNLLEIEEIKQLKYRYQRYMMLGKVEAMADLFTEDVTADYTDGEFSFEGREALIEFLRGVYRPDGQQRGIWVVGHPEIELTGEDAATGIWFFRSLGIDHQGRSNVQQGAFYHDTYVKRNGRWRIRHTGYRRVLEESWSRDDTPSLVVEVG